MNTEATESGKQRRQRQVTETRRELFARLENPEISLEEAAILLNLCRATIRRYSDSGLLPSHRTPGGQRRFYFQDVKRFMLQRQKEKKKR
jgi:excisionase family DNA binding protein